MKGLVINPAGRIIELPIKANFKEGAEMLEYFIAQHGGRKGRSDTALKTASAGYLTRRLVDAVQDTIIREEDCLSKEYVIITRSESEKIGEAFTKRVYGRNVAEDVLDKKGNVILAKGTEINTACLEIIEENKVVEIKVRSVLTCHTEGGICRKCYGRDLSTNEEVVNGTAVGIIAAQSIGEPGTQLTMRTFHMGGVAEGKDITQGLPRVEELFEARTPKNEAPISEIDGKVTVTKEGAKLIVNIFSEKPGKDEYLLVDELEAIVKVGDKIKDKQIIAKRIEGKGSIKAKFPGKVTSIEGKIITIEHLEPQSKEYAFSYKESLKVHDGDMIKAGTPLIEGHLNLRQLIKILGVVKTQQYIVKEVQSIYASQGQTINDKHIEVIVRQMFSKARVIDPGTLDYLPGQVIDYLEVADVLADPEKKAESGLVIERLLLGLTRLSLSTNSWLSAASFQETIRVLVEAAVTRKIDRLNGLKENVIIGKLIPVGTNYERNLREELTTPMTGFTE
jgi:DNA-directed RNA polymerase subunit beta'